MIIKFLIFNLLLYLFRCNTKVNFTYPQNDFLRIDSENIEEAFENNDYWLINLFKGSELISTYSNDITNYNNIKSWIYYITTPLFVGVQDENELKSYETENNIFLTCSENLPADLFDVAKLYKEECYFINITNPDMCTRMNIKTNELHVMSAYNHSTYDLDTLDRELLKLFVNKNRFPLVMKIDHRNFFNIRSSVIMMLLTAILVIHTIYKYYMSYTHNTYIEKEEKSE
ncbi:hypothetical protein C923_03467 [Plasmodium falciparum UGT5.1]|uniref:Uncharacterized protein n=1 Tax=Plasmodium falciparum UGT5.1 TaxID=1237627 RepID=W7JAR8_PLAFA|nr:hypothetical protein C923_03467 [Plasmodium falciparum UGT5.1]